MDHPATSLGEVLARTGVDSPPVASGDYFLSVVVRTQGLRPHLLRGALASLADQTDRDFEVVVVRHRVQPGARAGVDATVATLPAWLRERTRVLDLDSGARGTPLNLGFEAARGTYIVALDDDDVVMPHWVATFRTLHDRAPGRALRAGALRQDVEAVILDGVTVAQPVAEPRPHWPREFELLDHLLMNQTPLMSIAFPRSVFHDLGERFDEELDTTEDWDFLLRAVTLVGVANSEEPTAIYRWWVGGESSHHVHDDAQWQRNHDLVQRRMDQRVMLMPHGTVRRLQELVELPRIELGNLESERDRLAARVERLEAKLAKTRRQLRRQRRLNRTAAEQRPAREQPGLWKRLRG